MKNYLPESFFDRLPDTRFVRELCNARIANSVSMHEGVWKLHPDDAVEHVYKFIRREVDPEILKDMLRLVCKGAIVYQQENSETISPPPTLLHMLWLDAVRKANAGRNVEGDYLEMIEIVLEDEFYYIENGKDSLLGGYRRELVADINKAMSIYLSRLKQRGA